MEIYKKIAKAKEEIKSSDLKKAGHNDYSNYDYFTPDQIELLVFGACSNNKLTTTFNLKRNEFGIYGVLAVIDIDSFEKVEYEMATDIPTITATNIAQQLGGCMTYTERYLKMSAFGISENALDPDSNPKPKTKNPTKKETTNNDALVKALKELGDCVSVDQIKKCWTKYKKFQSHETFKLKKDNLKKELS